MDQGPTYLQCKPYVNLFLWRSDFFQPHSLYSKSQIKEYHWWSQGKITVNVRVLSKRQHVMVSAWRFDYIQVEKLTRLCVEFKTNIRQLFLHVGRRWLIIKTLHCCSVFHLETDMPSFRNDLSTDLAHHQFICIILLLNCRAAWLERMSCN